MTKEQLRHEIGKNIKTERFAFGMSLHELAELLDVKPNALYAIERGARGATPMKLLKLSQIFNLPIDHFFGRSQSIPRVQATTKQKKLSALLTHSSDEEIDFIFATVKQFRVLTRNNDASADS